MSSRLRGRWSIQASSQPRRTTRPRSSRSGSPARARGEAPRILSFVDIGLTNIYLIFLLVSGLSEEVADAVESVLVLEVALYTLIVFGAFTIVQLPLVVLPGLYPAEALRAADLELRRLLGDALKAGVTVALLALGLAGGPLYRARGCA